MRCSGRKLGQSSLESFDHQGSTEDMARTSSVKGDSLPTEAATIATAARQINIEQKCK